MSWKKSVSLFLALFLAGAAALHAGVEEHQWSINGSLMAGKDDNEVFAAVTNDTAFAAAALEVHYDTTLLEVVTPTSDVALINRAADLDVFVSSKAEWDFVRIVAYSTDAEPPYDDCEAGSGNVLRVVFKVKDGVVGGVSTTITLTTKNSAETLATQEIAIEEDPFATPGDPAEYPWSLNGVMIFDSLKTELYVVVKNTRWLEGAQLALVMDPGVFEIPDPVDESVARLIGRAADMELTATLSGDTLKMNIYTDESSPQIEPGGQGIVALILPHDDRVGPTTVTGLELYLEDGTELATVQLTARSFEGPSSDIDGDGNQNIFDLLALLRVLGGSTPKTVFSDVDGDGDSDIFDLLALLGDLSGN